jgi:hypothetical protein
MVYFKNTSKYSHLSLSLNTDCSNEDTSATHIDIPPFKTVNFGGAGECGVGSLEISTVDSSPSENTTHHKTDPNEKPNIPTHNGKMWWKGMIPLETMATIHIFPEKGEVFSDMPGSVKILIPNDLLNKNVFESYFAEQLAEAERGAEAETIKETRDKPQPQVVSGVPVSPSTPHNKDPETPSRLPSFSTIIKLLLVILGVIGFFWYIMKDKKRLSLY